MAFIPLSFPSGRPRRQNPNPWNVPTQPGLGQAVLDSMMGPPAPLPSLNDILAGDPLFQQFLADLRGQSVEDRAGLRSARQRALTLFGEVPDFRSVIGGGLVGDIESDITGETRALAGQATQSGLSTTARLEEARKTAAQQLMGYLTSRGLLRSGETGYQQGRLATDYMRARFDAVQKLLDYLAGYQSSFTAAERQRKLMQYQAALTSMQNWAALNPFAGTQPTAPGPYGDTFAGLQLPTAPTTSARPPGWIPS